MSGEALAPAAGMASKAGAMTPKRDAGIPYQYLKATGFSPQNNNNNKPSTDTVRVLCPLPSQPSLRFISPFKSTALFSLSLPFLFLFPFLLRVALFFFVSRARSSEWSGIGSWRA